MLVMCSSDARPKYLSDIAMVLATPAGARFRFRYQTDYLSSDVLERIGENSLVGTTALVCFIGNRGQQDKEFLIPVRLAKVCAVEKIGKTAYVFSLQASDYPDLEQWPRNREELTKTGSSYLRKMISNCRNKYHDVNLGGDGLFETNPIRGAKGWDEVAERLLYLPTFKNSYLLHLELVDRNGFPMQIKTDSSGWLEFDPRKSYRVRVWFYGNNIDFEKRARTIKLETNGEVLSSISDQKYIVQSRYDRVDFWFTPKMSDQAKRTLLRLVSSPSDPSDIADIYTEVELRCLVTRPLGPRMALAFLMGFSATAVAVPGIFGDVMPMEWRFLCACIGALGAAIGTALR